VVMAGLTSAAAAFHEVWFSLSLVVTTGCDTLRMWHCACERHLVGPAHDHDKEHQHLQQQHLLPCSSSAIATLLVAPNAHSTTGLHLKILGFQDFERLKFLIIYICILFFLEVFRVLYFWQFQVFRVLVFVPFRRF
jgi:hypothetical protein